MTPTLYIFAKRPVPGQVKTRLARSIGDEAACEVYIGMLGRIIDALADRPAWRTILAVTPDEAAAHDEIWPRATPRTAQGDGDLGMRMHRFLAGADRSTPVVIVGSDIPDMTADHVAGAFAALAQNDLVFGPAVDGGYWLVGASMPPPAGLFAGVRWSGPHALADTLANARGLEVAQLDIRLEDVDDAESLARHLDRHRPQR